MKFFFAAFLLFLSLTTVLGHSVEDLPEAHIADDFIDTVVRRSRPKRRRVIRRLAFKLKKLNRLLRIFKRRTRRAQGALKKRARAAKKAVKSLKEYKKCIRKYRGRKRRACGNGVDIQKLAFKATKRRAAARAQLKAAQRRLGRIEKDAAKVQGKLDKVLGNMAPRPSVSPLAIA